jgi:RNA polymerase sigma factor (sigma-70 family)
MRDRDMVAAIVAGDPAGLAAAYDHYAPALYAYCRSLLSEPADAADAVQDTFVVAAAKLSGLRDPDRFRPWLYAVARNECRRWLRGRSSSVPLDEADEMSDATADFGTALEQAELREIVRAALDGLNSGERDVIELTMRHEFYGADLADALGVPLNQAHALASRARAQFETSLGALLVARSGQESCPGLADVLDGWDGQLTVLLRKQVKRHIERCEVCGERRRRELSPTALLAMLPVVVLPAGLREQTLRLVAETRPDAVAYRGEVENESEPFARSGFPVPLDPPAPVRGPGTFAPAAGATVAALAVLGGGVMFTADVVHHGGSGTTVAATVPSSTPSLPSATPAPAAATPSPKKTVKPSSAGGSQAGFGPTQVVRPATTKPKTTKPASPKPSTTKTTPKTPPPTTPPPTTPPPTTPPPTTPPPTTPSAGLSLNLGLDPASLPLLSGAGVVTSAVFFASPAGLPGTLYLVMD